MADEGEDKAAGATPQGARERTEWTASDSRGPLNAAGDPEGKMPEHVPEPAGIHEPLQGAAPHEFDPHETVAEPASEPRGASMAAATQVEEKRPVPVVAIVLGLIVGAIIGAGSAALMYAYGGVGTDTAQVASRITSLSSRIDALEKRPDPASSIDELKSSVAALSSKVDAASKAADARPAFDPAPLQQKMDELQGKVDAVQKQAADGSLDQKVTALATNVTALQQQGADVKGLDGRVSELATALDGVNTTLDGMKKEDASTQAGIASLQTGQTTLQGTQKELAGKISSSPALAVAADSLVDAIGRGQPYAGQVDALASLGADPAKVAVLRQGADKGVPSAQVLAAKFEPLADPIMATGYHAAPNAGLMDKLKSGVMSMVSVRPIDATTGDSLGARVSRIEADLAHDDVAGAYSTWDGLPPEAKAKSEAWGALAKTHVEAMNAARALQQQAITALGTKKS